MKKMLLWLSLLVSIGPTMHAQTVQHTVTVSWIGSTSTNVGYHVYRLIKGSTTPAVKISSATNPVTVIPCTPLVTGQTCYSLTDSNVVTGNTYGYTVTAYDLTSNAESTPTPEVDATIITIAVIVPPTGVRVTVIQ
jgi:hypothetical protein